MGKVKTSDNVYTAIGVLGIGGQGCVLEVMVDADERKVYDVLKIEQFQWKVWATDSEEDTKKHLLDEIEYSQRLIEQIREKGNIEYFGLPTRKEIMEIKQHQHAKAGAPKMKVEGTWQEPAGHVNLKELLEAQALGFKGLNEDNAIKITCDLLHAYSHLQEAGVGHCDLKENNI